jgi:hypothetical protein
MNSSKDKKVNASSLIKMTAKVVPGLAGLIDAMKEITRLHEEEGVPLEEIQELIKKRIDEKSQKKSKSIVELMINERKKTIRKVYTVLAITLLGQWAFASLTKTEISTWFVVLILLFASIVYLNQAIFQYRVKKGFYGTNDYEAREITEFIFINAKHIDFNDGDSVKRISPEAEKETRKSIVPKRGVTT